MGGTSNVDLNVGGASLKDRDIVQVHTTVKEH